ncbi:MAG: glutamate--tRNA ligase [Candidatus Glassbacteria bacterium]|nr:glutamate--tRNA ligase [Candidatus Glassbacteria bacterium]
MNDKKFRVRFAPSPTGLLHIGNARTAILNWLLAGRFGGQFILRIEDTDTERSTRQSEASILEDLRWLGLDWAEGPDTGGDFGPYRQSERKDTYRKLALQLVEQGVAYWCRLDDEQMEAWRRERLADGGQPVYRGHLSGPDRPGSDDDPASIRFRVPEGSSAWTDLAKGAIEVGNATISDFIILRSDGRPTYNFAVVADDLAMRISHVVRGDGHISNTPRQLMLYRALGARAPGFAHIPMILGPDGKLLSKRHGATSLAEYRRSGYLPQALINYLSLLSWSSPSGEEFLGVERIRSEIDFDRLGKSAAVFDPLKLRWLNGKHIRHLPEDRLAGLMAEFAGGARKSFDSRQWRLVVEACRDKLELLTDVTGRLEGFAGRSAPLEGENRELAAHPDARKVLEAMAGGLERVKGEIEPGQVKTLFKDVEEGTGVKGKLLYMPVRLALTGTPHGPDLPSVVSVIGAEKAAGLIRKTLSET